jgi:uncharacterized membrane protein HdeD (DUF308 family)
MFMVLSEYWWVLVLRGAFAILFGVLAFTLPRATMGPLVIVFGTYAFADGIFAMVAAVGGRPISADWWILLLQGLLGIGICALTLFNPALTAVALLVYIAIWAIVSGVLQVFAVVKLRHDLVDEWWLALGGILGAAFGIALLWQPRAGALALLWLIASFAIVWGVLLTIGGFEVHRARTHALSM